MDSATGGSRSSLRSRNRGGFPSQDNDSPLDSRPDSGGSTRLGGDKKGVQWAMGNGEESVWVEDTATRRPVKNKNPYVDMDTESGMEAAMNKRQRELDEDFVPPKGCWYYFTKCLGGIWATREMNVEEDPQVYVRTTIRELVIYTTFVLVLSFITFGMTSAQMYFYTTILKSLFSASADVSDPATFWNYLENDFLDNLYWEYQYAEGSDANFICPGGDEAVGPCPVAPTDRNILYENRLLGVPRLRQLRVKNGSCEIYSDMQLFTTTCLPEYNPSYEDKDKFGYDVKNESTIRNLTYTDRNAWKYQTQDELDGVTHTGLLATYDGGGYVQDLHSVRNQTHQILRELRDGLWTTRATRLVTIDFTVYNANLNYFCIIKIVFEFPATGGVVPSLSYNTVKLLRYVTRMDYFVMACEFILACFLAYYAIEEFIEIKKNSIFYFGNLWNVLDVVVIGISSVMLGFVLITFFMVESQMSALLGNPDEYADFTTLASWASLTENATSMCIFFGWVKFLKYVSFNKTMTQLTKTLQRASGDLAGFGIMFAIVFIAFSQAGYMLFGPYMKDYHTMTDSVFSLLRTILGDFDWAALEKTEPFLGPLYFLSYVMAVFFIMLNMFLAIINDTYAEVKEEIAASAIAYDIGDYFKRGYNNWLGKFGTRDRAIDIENALKLSGTDGEITFEGIRQNLKKMHFSDIEIEVLFCRYDVDGNETLGMKEAEHMLDDLDDGDLEDPTHNLRPESSHVSAEFDPTKANHDNVLGNNPKFQPGGSALPAGIGRSVAGPEVADSTGPPRGGVVTMGEMEDLADRIDYIEESLGAIIRKIDGVFRKLHIDENSKARKRAAMDSIFNGEGGVTFEEGEFEQFQKENNDAAAERQRRNDADVSSSSSDSD